MKQGAKQKGTFDNFEILKRRKMMKTKIIRMLSIAALGFFLTFGSVFAAEPIKIGIVWPLTGANSAAGSYMVAGVEIGKDKINADGGILGRPVKLLIEDGAQDPAISVSAAEKLITRDKIDLFMGAMGSSPTIAVSTSVTRKYGIPHVVETAGAGKVTNEDGKRPNPWLFRISPTNKMEAEGSEKNLQKMGITKAALLLVNTDWGRDVATLFPPVLERIGGKVVSTDFFNLDQSEFLTQLTKIKSSGADGIIFAGHQATIAVVLKQYKQLGLTQKILTLGGGIVPEGLVELAGKDAAEGVYINTFFMPWFPELTKIPQEAKWFVDEYLKRGNPVKGFGECFRGYDGLKAMKAALEIAKTTDKEKVREAFDKVDTWGLSGHIKFDSYGQSTPTVYVVTVKDGKPAIPDFMK
jgi:branched-chain amino acid transport system substrate-binding protein